MQNYLAQLLFISRSLSKKNCKQYVSEVFGLFQKSGLNGKITFIESLVYSIINDKETQDPSKSQLLKDEICRIVNTDDAIMFKNQLTTLKLSNTQVKSLQLNASGEYLFGLLPTNPSLLAKPLLFDYLCEHPKEKLNNNDISSLHPFSIYCETPITLGLPVPPIHTISEEIIGELGPACVGSKENFSSLLTGIYGESMTEQQVGELIILLMQLVEQSQTESDTSAFNSVMPTEKEHNSTWNFDVIGAVLKQKCNSWDIVAQVMDSKGYACQSIEAVLLLVRIFQQIGEFPFISFFKNDWKNGRAQGCIVHKLLWVASQSGIESQYLMKYFCSLFNVGTQRGIRMVWEQQAFIERLITIGEKASSEFDSIYYSIDTVLPILCKCKTSPGRQRALLAVLRMNLRQIGVIQAQWKNNKGFISQGLRDLYFENPSSIDDIINSIGTEEAAKVLTQMKPTSFALDVACILSKNETFNIEKWLNEQIKNRKNLIGKEIIQFIREKHLLMKTVSPYKLDSNVIKQLTGFILSCGIDIDCNDLDKQFYIKLTQRENIPTRANEMFGQYFAGKFTAQQFVEEIKKAKMSKESVDNDLFVLLIKTLFDEFKRIKDFPKVDTAIQFGKLYGEIIGEGVINNCALIHLLRVILWAVRESPQSNFFFCGVNALQQFSNRLREWPTYCYLLKDIKTIESYDSVLFKIICDNANSKFSVVMSFIQKLFNTIKLQGLLDSKNVSIIKALTGVMEIMGGMDADKLNKEIEDVFERLKPQQHHKKVLIEISFFIASLLNDKNQVECIRIINEMGSTTEHLFSFTIESINIFLKLREFDKQNSSLFESLGSLLGLLTIGKDKPLRSNRLIPKSLLTDQLTIENYSAMLEFIIHFLMASVESKVFTPNNPWIQPLLQIVCGVVLKQELTRHHFSANKLLQLISISPEQYLEVHPMKLNEQEALYKLLRFAKEKNSGDDGIFNEFLEKNQPIPEKKLKQALLSDKSLCFINTISEHSLPIIPDYLICPSLLATHWSMIITYFLDFSLQDICKTTSVSLNTIMTTVTQLVQKDFSMETDINKISEAADRVFLIAQKLLQYTCRSCLESKMWKYLNPFVNISLKQKEIPKPVEQMKEIVMNHLQPLIEMAVELKLGELRKNAKRQLELFISQITPERQAAIAENNNKFIAKGFEYLSDGPTLPEQIQIAQGGVSDYQMEMYGVGIRKEIRNELKKDDQGPYFTLNSAKERSTIL